VHIDIDGWRIYLKPLTFVKNPSRIWWRVLSRMMASFLFPFLRKATMPLGQTYSPGHYHKPGIH